MWLCVQTVLAMVDVRRALSSGPMLKGPYSSLLGFCITDARLESDGEKQEKEPLQVAAPPEIAWM